MLTRKILLAMSLAVILFAFSANVLVKANGSTEPPVDPTPIVGENKKSHGQPRISVEQSLSPDDTGVPDAFGYVWDDGHSYGWIDITS